MIVAFFYSLEAEIWHLSITSGLNALHLTIFIHIFP